MIKFISGIIIFCIILFLYLHIQFHLKTSDDLEIFEMESSSKERLEEILLSYANMKEINQH